MKIILVYYVTQLFLNHVQAELSASDYDSYGIRFTANEFLIIEAQNIAHGNATFAIQFYNSSGPGLSCTSQLNNPFMYVYSVSIGMNQTIDEQYFAFNGQMQDPNSNAVVAFIGVGQNKPPNPCNFTLNYTILTSSQYNTGEYYVITVDPQGHIAYGFAYRFIVLYNLTSQDVSAWNSEFTDYYYAFNLGLSRFMPHAVAATNAYVILVGVIDNTTLDRWIPTAYLIDVRNCTVYMNESCMPLWQSWPGWIYEWPLFSWERQTANADNVFFSSADQQYDNFNDAYAPKFCLAVDINPTKNEVLFGIQYFNTVIRLSVDTVNFNSLVHIDQRSLGPGIGFGKSVKYAQDGSIVILANNYSTDYQTWYSSSIQTYGTDQRFSVTPTYVFPNFNQPLWSFETEAQFLAIQVTSFAQMFINDNKNVFVLLHSPPGYYSNISSNYGTNQIYFSQLLPCNSGTYSSDTSLDWCQLCPSGTFSSETTSINCTSCSSTTSFCPLGSVGDTPGELLYRITQIRAYPTSPDNTIFDDILILNMFSLNTSKRRCLVLSPLFWSLIAFSIASFITIIMGLLKLSAKFKSVRRTLKRVFRRTDLIGEGELWVGGLVSLSILTLCFFAYSFSNSYLNQYPIETVGNSTFACDESLRNAKFDSSLQLLVTADTSIVEQQELFTLMDEQPFTLHVQFINSLFQCDQLQVSETTAFQTTDLRCACSTDNNTAIMSIDVQLTEHLLTVDLSISLSQLTAGGLIIGLSGKGASSNNNQIIVQELNFQEVFNVTNQTLTQNPKFGIELVKVINCTQSLQTSSEGEQYSGLFIPVFTYDPKQVFYNKAIFDQHTSAQTDLQIQITKSTYYVRNTQQPIARQSEILFHNLLFTIVCTEIFGLVFLVFKLILLPIFRFLLQTLQTKTNRIFIIHDDDDDDDPAMKKRIQTYLTKLEEKEKGFSRESSTALSPTYVNFNETGLPRHRLLHAEPSANTVHFIFIRRVRRLQTVKKSTKSKKYQ